MNSIDEAISEACASAGIGLPRGRDFGKWLKADTLSGRNGRGDGRVMINDMAVVAFNWQTGETVRVSLLDRIPVSRRREIREVVGDAEERRKEAEVMARVHAEAIVKSASMSAHAYLVNKGFPDEKVLTISRPMLLAIVGGDKSSAYLVAGDEAIVMPARAGSKVTSVQLIWEDGTKKFLFGGSVGGSAHRISTGNHTWFCEGFATGLSLRLALRAMGHASTILCCFSASNVARVANSVIKGQRFIAADNDKPIPQYGGLGAGEYFACNTRLPFTMPPNVGDDFNDMHLRDGIFAVQRHLTHFIRSVR